MKLPWDVVMLVSISFWETPTASGAEVVKLPPPAHKGKMSVEEAVKLRRTVRHFASRGLSLEQVSQLLWGTDGVSDPRGFRTAPSAGATFPLELYLVVGERGAANLTPGLYRYLPLAHALEPHARGDLMAAVARASLFQAWMAEAPVMVVFAAEFKRTTNGYGHRGLMYTHMEVGSASQNLFWGAFGPPDSVPRFPDAATAIREVLYQLFDADGAVNYLTRLLGDYPEIIDIHFWAQFPGEPVESGSARMEYIARHVLPRVRANLAD